MRFQPIALVVVLFLTLSVDASAAHHHHRHHAKPAAQAVDPHAYDWLTLEAAARYWGQDLGSDRCPGGVTITDTDWNPAAMGLEDGLAAYTTIGAGCVIHTSQLTHGINYGAYCRLIVHEYGHLLGRTHDDPDPVMHPDQMIAAPVSGCGQPSAIFPP